MRQMQGVLWTKGLLLSPQHLQLHDRYFEDQLAFMVGAMAKYPWGFNLLKVDPEALDERRVDPCHHDRGDEPQRYRDGGENPTAPADVDHEQDRCEQGDEDQQLERRQRGVDRRVARSVEGVALLVDELDNEDTVLGGQAHQHDHTHRPVRCRRQTAA